LKEGTPVGTSLIDAHAGGVGTLESIPKSPGTVSSSGEQSSYNSNGLTGGCTFTHKVPLMAN
jgi:hypothetical protein